VAPVLPAGAPGGPGRRPPLSVAVITLNEEARLGPCLASVAGWADEIVVVDSGSADRTVEVARAFTDQVSAHPFQGYGAQKNLALARCRHEWVLSLDADERVTPELRAEIDRVLGREPAETGFAVPRRNLFGGVWLRHGGLYPDYQLRLFRRSAGRFVENAVHESVTVSGQVGTLAEPMLHHSYRDLEDFVRRSNRYSTLSAQDWIRRGRRAGLLGLVTRPLGRFFSMYIVHGGFLDGWRGFVLAVLYAEYVFLRMAKVWETRRGGKPGEDAQTS
jgi:glycosyltransferase involved in cell wall biosynthesis